MVGDFFSK